MKKLISLTVVIVLIMLGHCRFAMADRVAICTSHANKRIITLDYLVDGSQLPCQVVYEKPTEKPGYRKILWRAKKSSGYCERKMDAFLRRLDGYGWQCAYEKQDEMPSTEESEPRPVSKPPDKPTVHDERLRQDQDGLAICYKNANKRILNLDYLVKDSPLPCQVVYKKPTEKPSYRKVLWRAKKTVGYCERKLKGFIRNLEKSGWRCSYQAGTITAIADNPSRKVPVKPSNNSETISEKQDKPVSEKPLTPPKSAEIVRLEDSYKAYCGEQQINLQKPLTKIAKALSGLKHDSSQLQDCSGIFHQVVRKFKREYCPNYDYPDVKYARETRNIAKWYHEQGELILVHDPLEKSPLIKPGAVMFYGYGGRQNQDFKAENLFIPKLGINHVGVVVSVVRDAKNQVMRYKLFHGRQPGKPSKVTDYHPRKPTRSYYPPFGNGKEQWVAIAPLVKQSTSSGKSGRVVVQYGEASYYANSLHGNLTANGERYDKNKLTAAHKTLAFGTRVKVTYLKTGQSVEVVINDRGPFYKKRIIDLSRQAAKQIGLIKEGHGRVKMEILK